MFDFRPQWGFVSRLLNNLQLDPCLVCGAEDYMFDRIGYGTDVTETMTFSTIDNKTTGSYGGLCRSSNNHKYYSVFGDINFSSSFQLMNWYITSMSGEDFTSSDYADMQLNGLDWDYYWWII